MIDPTRAYWDRIAERYQHETHIACDDIHYGPLIPGDRHLGLMPDELAGIKCLELGCGAGQNSICLAARGARCVAVDVSAQQLQRGRALARKHDVEIAFLQADLEALPLRMAPRFDLVHSAYALPFLNNQQACIEHAAALLRPGGTLILSTAHPVAAGEWVTLDNEEGIFLPSYFSPPCDQRSEGVGAAAACHPQPLSSVFGWLVEAGLTVERFLEPKPVPLAALTEQERNTAAPYWSEAWVQCSHQLERIPFVAIFRAEKPAS